MANIVLFGEDLKLAFNLATQICYERITDKAFDLVDLSKVESRIALMYAMIVTSNPDTKITFDKIATELTFEDLKNLSAVVDKVVSDWYNIPGPANMPDTGEEDNSKND